MSLQAVVWAYRGFILASVRREFAVRYQRSILGFAWALINPLAMIAIYLVVFGQIMGNKIPGSGAGLSYGIYLCTGILAWSLFQDIVNRCQSTFLENANLLKNISFPRASLPAIVVLAASAGFILNFGVFVAVLLMSGHFPGISIIAIAPVLVILVILATGLGVVLGVLNVFFRDVGQATTSILQIWFWLTPVVYPSSAVPAALIDLIGANPITPLVEALHAVFVRRGWPDWGTLVYPAIVAILLCLMGLYWFRRNAADLVDEL